jgi:integrase
MPNYKGKRPGTRRIVLWTRGKPQEWIVRGSKRDGDEFEAKKRLELRSQLAPSARRVAVTFFALCEEYAVHAERHLKASTWNSRKFQIDALTTHMGAMRLPEIHSGVVEDFKKKRLDDKLMPSSINNELRVLRTVLKWGAEVGHDVPVVKWRRLPERGASRVRAFSRTEIERIYASCRLKAPTLLPMLVFLLNTGCRRGEAVAAEWSWIDFDASMVRIPSNEHWQPKNGRPREIPMSDVVRAVLSGPRKHPRWVFPTVYGKQFRSFPKELWERLVKHAGLTGGVHQTRHTFASHFLSVTGDLFLLAQILGHSHSRVTELYAHLLPDHLGRARNAVNMAPETLAVTVCRGGRPKKKTA